MKLTRLIVALACLMGAVCSATAQDDLNPTVIATLNKLNYNPKIQRATAGSVIGEVAVAVLAGQTSKEMIGYENAVRAAVLQGISRSYRITAVDALTDEDLEYPYTISIDGDITNMTTTTKTDVQTYEVKGEKKTRTVTYFRGQVAVTLQVKDAHDLSIIASPNFNVMATDMAWIETPEGAMNKTLEVLAKKVYTYFNGLFPLTATIIERAGEKNDKQKEVYVDVGSRHGIAINDVLIVYKPTSIGGKSARTEIARLKVKKIEGEEVSFCKVTSNGKALKAALDAGEDLIIETR